MKLPIWNTIEMIIRDAVALVRIRHSAAFALYSSYVSSLDLTEWQLSDQIRKKVEQRIGRSVSVIENLEILKVLEEDGLVESAELGKQSSDLPGTVYIVVYRLKTKTEKKMHRDPPLFKPSVLAP